MTIKTLSPLTHGAFHCVSGLVVAFVSLVTVHADTAIEQFGITWTFDSDYPTGRFANGDYWVVGPVNITSITPSDPNLKDETDLHGAMINPIPDAASPYFQSWDSRIGNGTSYDRGRNVARQLPLSVSPGTSLVSARSFPDGPNRRKLWISDAAVLTVLDAPAPPGSFRPPYAGTDKRIIGGIHDLDLSVFRHLPQVPGTPKLLSVESAFSQPLIDILCQWQNSHIKNANAGPNYGRDIARQVGDVALMLNLDFSKDQKLPLLIKFVQRGIDTYGLAKAGMVWFPNGGHNTGRKLPMLVAAKALGDADMLVWSDAKRHFIFQEDMQHWYVNQLDISMARGSPDLAPYLETMLGIPEWASNPITERNQTSSAWDKSYRIVNGVADTGLVLSAEIMGLRHDWNWEALFDYITQRFWPAEGLTPSSSQRIPVFHCNMWTAYHDSNLSEFSDQHTSKNILANLPAYR